MFLSNTKKSPYYQLTLSEKGKRKSLSTKTANYREAQLFLLNFLKEKENELKESSKQIYVSQFRDEYVSYLKSTKSLSYIRSVELSFKKLINYSGEILIDQIDVLTLDKFIASLISKSPKSSVVYYRTLKAAFSKAVQWNLISENLFKKIKTPKVVNRKPVFISESELQLILEKTKEEFLYDLFLIAFNTGMRLGELVNVKWSWVDLRENIIAVRCSDHFITKSKKERVIPISNFIQTIIRKRIPKIMNIKNDDYVFYRVKGVRLNENYVSKKFKSYLRAAGLDEIIHFHTLRHSFASLLVQRGISLYVIKELLGHEALSTTQIYSHLQQQNLRDAVNLL